jgi:hypothetical protein
MKRLLPVHRTSAVPRGQGFPATSSRCFARATRGSPPAKSPIFQQ